MKNKILVIDNYDSFTYNLVHYLEDLDCEVEVFRNDMIDINHVNNLTKFYYHQDQVFLMKLDY